jgi:hypothetical protein
MRNNCSITSNYELRSRVQTSDGQRVMQGKRKYILHDNSLEQYCCASEKVQSDLRKNKRPDEKIALQS